MGNDYKFCKAFKGWKNIKIMYRVQEKDDLLMIPRGLVSHLMEGNWVKFQSVLLPLFFSKAEALNFAGPNTKMVYYTHGNF